MRMASDGGNAEAAAAAAAALSTTVSGAGAMSEPILRRWLSLLNDTQAARYYNATREYWPPADEQLDAWTLRHDRLETLLLCAAYTLVFVAGVLGNAVVIGVVLRTPQLRTTTNQFIVSLAAADLMVNCLCLPFTLVANLFKVWSMGKAVCKVVGFLQGVSVTASVLTLMAIAVERCQVIRHPLVGGLSRRRCRHCIVALWLFAIAVNVPSLYVFTLQPFPNRSQLEMCLELWPSRYAERVYFILINVLLGYLGPLLVITGCYALIWHKVAHRRMPGERLLHEQQLARNRLKATRMVLVVIVTFALSWLPLYILFCVVKFYEQVLDIQWVRSVFYVVLPLAQWLGAANSCLNPLLYAYLNRRFRKYASDACRRLLAECCRPGHHRGTQAARSRRKRSRAESSCWSCRRLMARYPATQSEASTGDPKLVKEPALMADAELSRQKAYQITVF